MTATILDLIAAVTGPRAIGAPGRSWLDGPEMATAFLSVAAACCAAPLNPAYKFDEFEFYLSDLNPAAIILAEGQTGPAAAAAEHLRIPVLTLVRQRAATRISGS